MSTQSGNQPSSYSDSIRGLKKELESHVARLKSATDWPDFVRLYRALHTIQEIAGVPRTTLEEILNIAPASATDGAPLKVEKKSSLDLGEQVETEPAAEIERGS